MGMVCCCAGLFSLKLGDFFGGQAKFPYKSISQPHKIENVSLGTFQVNNDVCRILCVGDIRRFVALGGFKAGDRLYKLVLNTAEQPCLATG